MRAPLIKLHQVANAWRIRCNRMQLSAGALKVLWSLTFGPEHGVSYKSQETLAEEACLDRSDVGKLLRALADADLIEIVSSQVLTAAMQRDGQHSYDKRRIGYRRILDPDTKLSSELGAIVTLGKPTDPKKKVRIAKKNTGTSETFVKEKRGEHDTSKSMAKNEGNVVPTVSGQIKGNVALDVPSSTDEMPKPCPPEHRGDVVPQVWGNVVSPVEELDLVEGDAVDGGPPSSSAFVVSIQELQDPNEQDRAPLGAVLTDNELYEADLFFGELFAPDRALLRLIKSHIGPRQFASDLQAIISAQSPGRIADWAYTVGLRDAA